MKKLNIGLFFILMLACLGSCSTVEELVEKENDTPENPAKLNPIISDLLNSDCLGELYMDYQDTLWGGESLGTFEMIIEDNKAKCKFTSLVYFCLFGKVMIDVKYKDDTMIIVEYCSSKNPTDCLCETNASFTIENIPDKDFNLKIYSGRYHTGEYDENRPVYSGRVILADGGIKVPYN